MIASRRAAKKTVRRPRREPRRREVDFADEESVLEEMARALDAPVEDLEIEEDSGLSGFREGTVYRIELGRQEYVVVKDHDQMVALALAVVTQDLEQEPEFFNKSFIENHINKDRLKRDLESDVLNSAIDRITEDAEHDPDDFWRAYEHAGFEAPEEDEDGERPEPTSSEIEDLAQHVTDEELRDPMQYLEDIYGREEAGKKAIEIGGLDIKSAAQEAVDTDGAEHFLARYDGNSHETKSGFVYWRDN